MSTIYENIYELIDREWEAEYWNLLEEADGECAECFECYADCEFAA